MTALIRMEFRRLVSRRMWRALSIVVLLLVSFFGVMAFVSSDDSPDAVAAAEARWQEDVDRCVADIRSAGPGSHYPARVTADPEAHCRKEIWKEDPRFTYRDITWIVGVNAFVLLLLGWLLGASAMGAEWQSRSITTMLTWESRRGRVLAAKLIATVALAFLWTLAAEIAMALAFYPAGEFEGSMAGVDAAWLQGLALLFLRIAGVGAGAAAFGFFLATIGRNTAAALGAGFVYLTAVEGLIRGFKPAWVDRLIGDNVSLIMLGSDVDHLSHSRSAAVVTLLVYAAVLGAVAFTIFNRREIA